MVWYASVYKVHKDRISRTNIICNEPISRPLESVRKYKPCGQPDRHIGIYQNRDSVLQTENFPSMFLPLYERLALVVEALAAVVVAVVVIVTADAVPVVRA